MRPLTWLALARDERVALHHRRAAAKRAARAGGRAGSETGPAALLVDLGVDRRDPRRRRRKEPGAVPEAAPVTPSGGIVAAMSAGTPAAVRRPGRPGRCPRRPRGAVARVPNPRRRCSSRRWTRRGPDGQRARRLGDEAIRAAPAGPEADIRAAALETALREAGGVEGALRCCAGHSWKRWSPRSAAPRCWRWPRRRRAPGSAALATAWRTDAGAPALVAHEGSSGDGAAETPEEHYRAAQRLLARGAEADGAVLLAHLRAALSGHAGADAALALAMSRSAAAPAPAAAARQRIELLRTAHAGEGDARAPRAPVRRLAETLEEQGDALGAVAVLETRSAETASQRMSSAGAAGPSARDAAWARAERVRLLRSLGRSRELVGGAGEGRRRAGGRGPAGGAGRARHAAGCTGEAEKALEVRRMALAEFPGAPTVLDDARRRLEATGRAAESLALAHAALETTVDARSAAPAAARRGQLTEKPGPGVNATAAAEAWLAVLESIPTTRGGGRRREIPGGHRRLGALRRAAGLAGGPRSQGSPGAALAAGRAAPRAPGAD